MDTPSPSVALASVSNLSIHTPIFGKGGPHSTSSASDGRGGVTSSGGSNLGSIGFHVKGCHCKKSHCLKKYCECYQAGLRCGDNCKCVECKNGLDVSAQKPPGSGNRAKKTVSVISSAGDLVLLAYGQFLTR